MAQTLSNLITHVIFSTKDRRPIINAEMRPQLFKYFAGILRELNCHPLGVNGTTDHVHLLFRHRPATPIATIVRDIKANSSRWVHQTWRGQDAFAWQTGYGAFSVSASVVPRVVSYIADQEIHHNQLNFQAEFLHILQLHEVQYDERYIWS